MFQLDDNFLEDVGLDNLPEDQKRAFLEHIYNELEMRVGTKLAEGLQDEQLEEFEALIDRDSDVVQEWLAAHVADYASRPDFQALQAQAKQLGADDAAVMSEYAATKWLEVNRPDYRDVVASVMAELKKEITANRDNILSSAT